MDLIEFAEFETVRDRAKAVFNSVDEGLKLALCRDLMIDQIELIIDKFPEQTQKEMVAMLVDRYMSKWNI